MDFDGDVTRGIACPGPHLPGQNWWGFTNANDNAFAVAA